MARASAPANGRPERPRSGPSATSLLLTVLGELVLPRGGAVWTATAVRGLGALDVDERNARQALLRLSEQGVIDAERVGRRTRWHLSSDGIRLLTSGAVRIDRFGAAAEDWDGRWLLVVCSVPEEQRAKRHQLRTRLGFAGFGFLGPGVAVSPHADREAETRDVLVDLELDATAVVLHASSGRVIPADERILAAWDLDALAADYRSFLDRFDGRVPRRGEDRFVALVELVHAWRRFPFADPELPARLLPARWPGRAARQLFRDRRAAWSTGAAAWFDGPSADT